jgi:hypothetical protein
VIARILYPDKQLKVIEAIGFRPLARQTNLRPMAIGGEVTIDLAEGDFMRELVRLRARYKADLRALRQAEPENRAQIDRLTMTEQQLKLVANSISSGVPMQINTDALSKPVQRTFWNGDDKPHRCSVRVAEKPGPWFHPLIGVMVPALAQLFMACMESLVQEQGLDWCYIATDGMGIAMPYSIFWELENFQNDAQRREAEFQKRVDVVRDWFEPLKPVENEEPLVKLEATNFDPHDTKLPVPLYCLSITSHRRALFNLAPDGTVVIRKASMHGIGHWVPPYEGPDYSTPDPLLSVLEDGLEHWQYDLWYMTITGVLDPKEYGKNYVWLSEPHRFTKPAASRYRITSPALERWFASYNEGRKYQKQIRPFRLITLFTAERKPREHGKGGRPKAPSRPVAPYHNDTWTAASMAFDRKTKEVVPIEELRTYTESLFDFGDARDAKFEGAYKKERRHVRASEYVFIGKEANRIEDEAYQDEEGLARVVEYRDNDDRAPESGGQREPEGKPRGRPKNIGSWHEADPSADFGQLMEVAVEFDMDQAIAMLPHYVADVGLRAASAAIGVSRSQLSKIVRDERQLDGKARWRAVVAVGAWLDQSPPGADFWIGASPDDLDPL